jgi:DNA mismatch repair protein MSH2
VEDTIELADIHHGRTVLKATLDGDLEALQQDLVRVRDLLDDEHDRVARDLGVEKNKKLHLENHQVYHYSLRITKAVSCLSSSFFSLLLSRHRVSRVSASPRSLILVLIST